MAHIRGVSDVDLLVLHRGFLTNDAQGVRAKAGKYTTLPGSVYDDMRTLRSSSEKILERRFWAVEVDSAGAKSIKLSGGSLKRKVDIVPAHWHDTAIYQISDQMHDREVRVWDKDAQKTVPNMPFMHMKRINDKDQATVGGLKKTIRLLKNIKKDAEDEGQKIDLSSYELASLMWHCHESALRYPAWQELSLLDSIDSHFEILAANRQLATTLVAPDNSRNIIDTPEKYISLGRLSTEIHNLTLDVAREANYFLGLAGPITREALRKALHEARVA